MTSLLRPHQELPTEPSALPGEVGKELSPELAIEKDETGQFPDHQLLGHCTEESCSPKDSEEVSPHLAEAQVPERREAGMWSGLSTRFSQHSYLGLCKWALVSEKGHSARTQLDESGVAGHQDAPTIPPFPVHAPPPYQETELIPRSLNSPSPRDGL